MHTQVDKSTEKRNQQASHPSSQKKNSLGSAYLFTDNRAETIVQRKLKEMANKSLRTIQTGQLQAIADQYTVSKSLPVQMKAKKTLSELALNRISGSGTIQRRGFADPANPNTTDQWENKGYISRGQGESRPPALAALVDQYKKEMLTYIAHYIQTQRAANYYGPHIAVIITGNNWNVSVNSNVSVGNQANLQADANLAKAHIDQCWQDLDNTYGSLFTTKTWFENDQVEAAYIAFRWAAGKNNVRAIANAGPAANRRVHGEMRIINTVQGEVPAPGAAALPGAMLPPGAAGPLPANYRRVVRVGGTKTPCLDCAWEMNKVPGLNQAAVNAGTGGAHGANHEAHMVGAGANEKVATTMSPTFGPSFPTWQSTNFARARRNNAIGAGGDPNFLANQAQNYLGLRAAYIASGCAPAML